MKSHDFPVCKQKVPDPYKRLAVLHEIWFREHGAPDVTITFEDPEKDDEDKADT